MLIRVVFHIGTFVKTKNITTAPSHEQNETDVERKNTDELGKAAFQMPMHGISQGFIAGVSGGDFFQGFWSAAVSSVVSSATGGLNAATGLSGTAGDISTMFFGTVSGGLSSKLTGGNFWEGAAIGLTVSGLNHVAHKIEQRNYVNERLDAIGRCATDVPDISMDEVNYLIDNDPTLNKMYNGAGQPKIEIDPNLNSEGRTAGIASENKITYMKLGHKAFKNYYYLYQSIGHELYHGLQFVSGQMGSVVKFYGKTSGVALMEAKAYMWNYKQDTTWIGIANESKKWLNLHLQTLFQK